MGRRPPRALRASPPRPVGSDRPLPRIKGLTPRTRHEIDQVERRSLSPGAVASALTRYRRFLAQPGRWLYLPAYDCPCCDIREARDTLDDALRALPPPARAEFGRIVAALDAEFLRRTLPDPWFPRISPWHASQPWWWHRLPRNP